MEEKENKLRSDNSEYNEYCYKKDKEENQNNNQNDNHNKMTEGVYIIADNSNPNDKVQDITPSLNIAKNIKPSKKSTYLNSIPLNSNKINYSSSNSKCSTYYYNKKRKRSSYKKKYPDKNLGRKTNEEKERGENGTHTKDCYDDWKGPAYKDCLTQLYHPMNDRCLKRYHMGLAPPTLSPLLENKSDNCLLQFSEYTVKEIFLGSRQSNIGINYSENMKENIEKILQKEKEDDKATLKLLSVIFNKKFKEILLEMYLNDYPFVKHFDGNFYLKGFKTIKDSFLDMDIEKKNNNIDKLSNLLELSLN